MKTQHTIKVGSTLSLKIKRLGINGEGIGFYKRTIIFVPGALPKEDVLVKVTTVSERYAEGSLQKITKKSPDRVLPPCPVYEKCGGCQLQHLAYPAQLKFKNDILRQSFDKYKPESYQNYQIKPTIGMEEPWHYRNKLQYQIQKTSSGKVIGGLYEPNSHQLVSIEDCLVQHPETTKVVNLMIHALESLAVPIYDEKQNSGIVKTIMVRVGVATKELQVVFITQSQKLPRKKELIQLLNDQFPQVVSIMQNVQNKKTSAIMGDETFHLWGKENIEEHLNDVVFDLSARAFFQLNPAQTSILYQEAIKAIDPKATDTIIDAYCGVGTIGLSIAKQVKEVRGMDTIPAAIADAQKNAERLNLHNTHYEVGAAEELLPKWLMSGIKIDGLLVDPPRTGLDKKLLKSLLNYPLAKMVYVSCNPSTLARDLVELSQRYNVDYCQSVDMFPQTARAEVVVKLTKK